MTLFNAGWYLLYVRYRQEKRIATALADNAIAYMLPTIKKISQWQDRKKVIEEPMFPSYIFVHPTNFHEFYFGSSLDGVVCYVKFGKEAATVPATTVEKIRLLTEDGAELEVCGATFAPGQITRIGSGPLKGLDCEVVQVKGKEKILVRVSLLQRSLLVNMPAQCLTYAIAHQFSTTAS